MNKYIDYFLNYLQTEKDAAKSTIHKYRADIEKLFEYLKITDINEINQNHLRDYLNHIRQTIITLQAQLQIKLIYFITSLGFFMILAI